jgi:hypothetical protein
MRLLIALPLLAAVALTACNKGGSVQAENESVESVAKKVAAADIKPLPGRWESSMKFENLEMAGMPPAAKDAMAKQMGQTHTFSSCLTPEQVNQPNGGFFAGGAEDCKYDSFSMAGGKIDAKMTCGEGAMKRAMTMNGSYSDTSYAIHMDTQSEVQPGKSMAVSVSIASKRVGDCNGKEDITAKDVKEMRDWSEKHAK